MSIAWPLKKYLDDQRICYEVLSHQAAHTASERAGALHIERHELAKVIILKVNARFVMVVLPADLKIDLKHVRDVFWTPHVRLATEEEFRTLFPGCDLGAMPPFGNLYGMDVYADGCLTTSEHIVFQAGTYTEAIRLPYGSFVSLVHPFIAEVHEAYPWAKAG